jgi:hypothetical protein
MPGGQPSTQSGDRLLGTDLTLDQHVQNAQQPGKHAADQDSGLDGGYTGLGRGAGNKHTEATGQHQPGTDAGQRHLAKAWPQK